ncbi:hypothetical protein ACWDV4_16215 [Micromonospora sp. NPDC003197]
MFERDSEFAAKATEDLQKLASDPNGSVVLRGRAILEVGRRAVENPGLADDLLEWAANPSFQRSRWVGAATLAWMAAAAVGYSQRDPAIRQRLREVLTNWDKHEVRTLLAWASREPWFADMDDLKN